MNNRRDPIPSTSDQDATTMTRRATRTPALPEIEARLKELKVMEAKKTLPKNLGEEGVSCHSCHRSFENKYILRCGFSDCQETFCLLCAVEVFKKEPAFVYMAFKEGKWTCFICSGLCTCDKCEQESLEEDVKTGKKQEERSREFEASKIANARQYKRDSNSASSSNKKEKTVESDPLIGNLKFVRNKIVPKPNYGQRKIKMRAAIQEHLAKEEESEQKDNNESSEEDTFDEERSEDGEKETLAYESTRASKFLLRKKRLWKTSIPVKNQLC
mmetsp:Transcript_13639/g.15646  ORF Transcript_13639/g.15646 Transcript_13639/m.15646 type:complete len:272 (-) Transcript_13639:139-954(-)